MHPDSAASTLRAPVGRAVPQQVHPSPASLSPTNTLLNHQCPPVPIRHSDSTHLLLSGLGQMPQTGRHAHQALLKSCYQVGLREVEKQVSTHAWASTHGWVSTCC